MRGGWNKGLTKITDERVANHAKLMSKSMSGHIVTEETRKKISEARKGISYGKHSEETRKKISESNKGKTRSYEQKLKISLANRGKSNGMFNKTGKLSPSWKGDNAISRKKNYCIDCNKEINYTSKRCYKCNKRGIRNSHYIDGRTTLRERIRNLDEYCRWRKTIYQRDNYTCQICKKIGSKLEGHHVIKSFKQLLDEFLNNYSQFSPIEDKETLVRLAITYEPFWDINNGITLCKECHDNTPHSWSIRKCKYK